MKYVVANLKNSLNDSNIEEYVNNIRDVRYDNLVICPSKKYISFFNGDNYELGLQDYSDEYAQYIIINHYQQKDDINTVKEKIELSKNRKLKIILCVGSNNIEDVDSIKKQIDEYIDYNYNSILIAFEPFNMIGNNENIDVSIVNDMVNKIRKYTKNKYPILYGGNVNEHNIERILNICDGVLVGRLSYDSIRFTKTLNKLIKNI